MNKTEIYRYLDGQGISYEVTALMKKHGNSVEYFDAE